MDAKVRWGLIDNAFNYGAPFFALLLGLFFLNSEEIALWTLFISFQSIVTLFDFGFSPSILRAASYAKAGAKDLQKIGFNKMPREGGDPNYTILFQLTNDARTIYWVITLIAALLFTGLGSYYFWNIQQRNGSDHALSAWLIFSLGMVLEVRFLYYTPLLQGWGKVRETYRIGIISNVIYIALCFGFLVGDVGIFSICWALALSVLIRRALLYREFWTKDFLKRSLSPPHDSPSYIATLIPNSYRMGVTMLGSILAHRGPVILAGLYMPLTEVSQYSLSMLFLTAAMTFSTTHFRANLPNFVAARIKNECFEILNLWNKTFIFAMIFYVLSCLAILSINSLSNSLVHKYYLMADSLLMLGMVIMFFEMIHGLSANFISTKNEIPFHFAGIISGVLIVLLTWSSLATFHPDPFVLLFCQGFVQALYNNWKWPSVALNELAGFKKVTEAN